MFSTWKGEPAQDGSVATGHSPYTKALLDPANGVFQPGERLSKALGKIERAMEAHSQKPEFWCSACNVEIETPLFDKVSDTDGAL